MVKKESKKVFYKSKGFWFALLAGTVPLVQYFGYAEYVVAFAAVFGSIYSRAVAKEQLSLR